MPRELRSMNLVDGVVVMMMSGESGAFMIDLLRLNYHSPLPLLLPGW